MSVISIENSQLAASSSGGAASTRKPTGFALPGYASRAGRKGQAMGLCRRWTAEEARRHSAAGVLARRLKRQQREASATP